MSEWRKGISKAGKIRTKAFSAVVTAMYPSQIKTGTGILQLDFNDNSNVGIFGVDKAKITDDGCVEVGGSLADFQESLEKLGYECQWGTDNNEILGFQTVPDIIGSKISMEPLEEQTVGDDSQTKKSVFWGIVTKVEKATTQLPQRSTVPGAKPGKLPKAKSPTPLPQKADPEAIAARILNEGVQDMPLGDMYTHFKKEYKPGELRTALAIIQG